MSDEAEDRDERQYVEGEKAAYRRMLSTCLRGLGTEHMTKDGWQLERAAAISVLRRICENHGNNEWPDDLHLADILTKYLEPYLDEEGE